jgi:DNA-binding MarR family transcriptional regulator
MTLVVTLAPSVSDTIRSALSALPGVTAVAASANALISASGPQPLRLERVGLGQIEHPTSTPGIARLIQIDGVLDDATAGRLEDSAIGYLDSAGRSWLPGMRRTSLERDTRKRARSLRGAGLRVAQLLADDPKQRWTERDLADRAKTSTSTAHKLLERLEDEGLMQRTGHTRGTVRTVPDPAALRRWLARNGQPSRLRRLACWVPDPHPEPTVAGLRIVLTGAAGAAELGMPVLTGPPRTLLRVRTPQGTDLNDIPSMLGGVRDEAGANTVLIDDRDGLGWREAQRSSSGALIAPPSRVMLDLWLEPRGQAAVDAFLELWGHTSYYAAAAPR